MTWQYPCSSWHLCSAVLVGTASSDVTVYWPHHKPYCTVYCQRILSTRRTGQTLIHSFEGYPEQAGEPAVLHCIVQMEVVVEVALQRLLFFLVANTTEQHRPACWAHRQRETRARRGLVTRGVHPRPGPLLWRTEEKNEGGSQQISTAWHFQLFITCVNCVQHFFLYLGPLCPLASEETCQSGWSPSQHPSSLAGETQLKGSLLTKRKHWQHTRRSHTQPHIHTTLEYPP